MKKIFVVLAVMLFMVGCGKTEQSQVSGSDSRSLAANKDYMAQGIKYLQQADAPSAIKSFDQAIRQNPKDARPYLILGETYMRLSQYNRAIDTLTAATQTVPPDGHLYYLLAVNYGLSGDQEQAKINIEKSIILFQRDQDMENLKKSVALLKGMTPVAPQVQ